MRKDSASMDAAKEIAALKDVGENIVNDAALKASGDMAEMLAHLKTPGGKAEALKAHAIHMGVGTRFLELVVPHAREMRDDLETITGSDSQARVMLALWLAKIFKEIEKGVANHEK